MPHYRFKGKLDVPFTEAQLRSIFKQHDTNKDGVLNKKELKEAFQHLGSAAPGWRAGRALSHGDRNGDGCISEQELDTVINYAFKVGYTVK